MIRVRRAPARLVIWIVAAGLLGQALGLAFDPCCQTVISSDAADSPVLVHACCAHGGEESSIGEAPLQRRGAEVVLLGTAIPIELSTVAEAGGRALSTPPPPPPSAQPVYLLVGSFLC